MTYSKNNSFTIAGMGKSGMSVASYLASVGVEYECCDDNKKYPDCDEVLKGFTGYVCKSPGMSADKLPDGKFDIINDVELFLRLSKKPVIMVTGTNGKTTVVSLVEWILSACNVNAIACGNNGVPVMQAYSDKADVIVLELSSYQLENISSFSSISSVVLNVGVDHVDRYHGMSEYESVKRKVYRSTSSAVYPVLETGDIEFYAEVNGFTAVSSRKKIRYSLHADEIIRNDELFCSTSDVGLPGRHNYLNVCAALCLIDVLGLSKEDVVGALKTFKGLPHRMELVCEDGLGRKWINDSKSTNVHSLRAALSGVVEPVCLIMGGRGKGEDYSHVIDDFSHVIGELITFGEAGHLIAGQAKSVENKIVVDNVLNAVIVANKYQGDVLFSPACASFDQYVDFNERGDDFKSQVERIAAC